MGVRGFVTRPRSIGWEGWPRGRRSPGRWVSIVDLGSAESAATKRKAQRAAHCGDRGLPSPAPSSFRMLLNPVTSTPFSVNDILRLEHEQIGPEALQLRGARRSPESPQYLLPVPEQLGSEVPSAGSGDGDRRQEGSESPKGLCETVTEMDAEPVGEPREYALGLGSYRETKGWGGSLPIISWGDTHLLVFPAPRASPVFPHMTSPKDRTLSPLYHLLQTS